MNTAVKLYYSRRVIAYELIAFLSIIIIIWLNEIVDIPHLILGGESTPINWRESIFESVLIGFLGLLIIYFTVKLFKRMKFLEGILPICSYCKRIKDEKNTWQNVEEYIHDKSEADFSHSICPECAKKFHPEFYKD